MRNESSKAVIRPLTGIRGVTIALVVIAHFWTSITLMAPGLETFSSAVFGMVFRVDIIFVLSGFVISYVYMSLTEKLTTKTYGAFLWGRFSRLYPTYLVAMLITIAGVVACWYLQIPVGFDCPVDALPLHLTLLQAWPFASWAFSTWNYPAWFLSALMFAYVAVFPFAWLLVHKLQGSRTALFWVFGPLVAWLGLSRIPWLGEFHITIQVTCEFICGCALMVLFRERSRFVALAQEHLGTTVVVLILLSILSETMKTIVPSFVPDLHVASVLIVPFFLAGLTAERTLFARAMASRPLVWLGEISYALFLSHAWVLKGLKILWPAAMYADAPALVRHLILAGHFTVLILVAIALRTMVEMPCASALKKIFVRRSTRPPATPQTAGLRASLSTRREAVHPGSLS